MILVAPRSAQLVETRGARFTLLLGYVFLLLAFGWMLLLWKEGSSYWQIGLAYAFIGIIAGEFILADSGLGHAIAFAYDGFENRTMYALMLFVLAVVTGINLVLHAWESRLMRRRARA